mmetsp:Transcript_29754/g.70948  ORF Transcript_29754/g.70948 Transcript_29754/m.70948 type:complete len:296 (-) Transcript_29754:386-1273(-)
MLQLLDRRGELAVKNVDCLLEQDVWRQHSGRLDREHEVVLQFPQLQVRGPLLFGRHASHLLKQLWVLQGVVNLDQASCARPLHVEQPGALLNQLICELARHRLQEHDLRLELVPSRGDGRPLGVLLAGALHAVRLELDDLARGHLGEEDVVVDGAEPHGVAARVLGVEVVLPAGEPAGGLLGVLAAVREPLEGAGVNRRVDDAVRGALALCLEPHDDRVLLARSLLGDLEVKLVRVDSQGDKPESVGEHLVLYNRSIVHEKDMLDGHSWDFGDEDAAERVGDCRVAADKVKLHCT